MAPRAPEIIYAYNSARLRIYNPLSFPAITAPKVRTEASSVVEYQSNAIVFKLEIYSSSYFTTTTTTYVKSKICFLFLFFFLLFVFKSLSFGLI
jgi:hypothetical protein